MAVEQCTDVYKECMIELAVAEQPNGTWECTYKVAFTSWIGDGIITSATQPAAREAGLQKAKDMIDEHVRRRLSVPR